MTYWNWFSTTTDAEYKVTAEDMYIGDSTYGPGTVVHDMSANSSDVADIYMTSNEKGYVSCLLYTSPSPRDGLLSRMPSSA